MPNYLCCAANPRVPDYLIIKVAVPTGETMKAGDVFPVTALDTDIDNNYQVFAGTEPATATLGNRMAIVINDGFETLEDGRRPAGQPDYTQYTFGAGEVVTAVLLVPGLMFEISNHYTGTIRFDEAGLPVTARQGHGLGSHSIAAFCEKYGASYRYTAEDGSFSLRVIL